MKYYFHFLGLVLALAELAALEDFTSSKSSLKMLSFNETESGSVPFRETSISISFESVLECIRFLQSKKSEENLPLLSSILH